MQRGDAALLHAGGGQSRGAGHITDGKDVGHRGAEGVVDGDAAPLIGGQASALEVQAGGGSLASGGVEQRVACDLLAGFEVRDHAVLLALDGGHLLPELEGHVALAQQVAQRHGDLAVD